MESKESKGTFIRSIMGGFLIGIGGTVYLTLDNKIIGSLFFSVGLLAICVTDNLLFTGKASYTLDKSYLATILFGNYIGATILGTIIRYTNPQLIKKAITICNNKLNEGLKIVPLGILCNILIYISIEGYKKGQTILLIMCVSVFILCGFEHCIANMYYFTVSGLIIGWKGFFYLFCNVFSNLLGGIIVQKYKCFKSI